MKPVYGNRVALFFTIGFVLASNSFAQVAQTEADQVRARQKVSLMESVLESAVANGADSLMRAVRAVMPPDALMLQVFVALNGSTGLQMPLLGVVACR